MEKQSFLYIIQPKMGLKIIMGLILFVGIIFLFACYLSIDPLLTATEDRIMAYSTSLKQQVESNIDSAINSLIVFGLLAIGSLSLSLYFFITMSKRVGLRVEINENIAKGPAWNFLTQYSIKKMVEINLSNARISAKFKKSSSPFIADCYRIKISDSFNSIVLDPRYVQFISIGENGGLPNPFDDLSNLKVYLENRGVGK